MTTETTTEAFTYKATTREADGISLTSARLIKGHKGVVLRSDGVTVWECGTIRGGDDSKRRAQFDANRQVSGFRRHYAQHGVCWHDQKQAKREAYRAWDKHRVALVDAMLSAVRKGVRHQVGDIKQGESVPPEFATKAERLAYNLAKDAARDLPPRPERA